MSTSGPELSPFVRRVRVLRAWRGLAVGLFVGSVLALIWASLDWADVILTEWLWLGAFAGGAAILGALVGAVLPISKQVVARSIDRRAKLKDRLATAEERSLYESSLDDTIREDAKSSLGALKPGKVFPVRLGRWQYSAAGMAVAAATVFFMSSSLLLLTPEGRELQAELAKKADAIERVAKPLEESRDGRAPSPEEKALAKELKSFAKKIRRAKLNEEEAMQRANELAEKAKKLAEQRSIEAKRSMMTASAAMSTKELEKSGISEQDMEALKLSAEQEELLRELMDQLGMDPLEDNGMTGEQLDQMGLDELSEQLMNLSAEQRQELLEQIQQMMDQLSDKQNSGAELTDQEMEMMKQLEQMQQSLEISDEAMKALQDFFNSPEFQDVLKMVEQMQAAAQQVMDGEPLTDEQIEQLEQAIEELAEALKDSEFREQVISQMKAALEKLKDGSLSCEAGGT